MLRLIALLAVLLPSIATAQGVVAQPLSRGEARTIEYTLWSLTERSMVNAGATGGYVLTAPVTLTRITGQITTASGGGAAANTVITVTDGTNTCTFTLACTTSATPGTYSITAANGAGTGCSYAAGATLSGSVTTAGCTTTQPTFRNLAFVATRRL